MKADHMRNIQHSDPASLPHGSGWSWGDDTIVALSTGTGLGAIGIVRMSGSAAVGIAEAVFRPGRGSMLKPEETQRLLYGHVFDPRDGHDVDEVLLAVMRAPHSYTREDVVEVQCHGGVAAQRAVLRLLVHMGARPADPGEFTKRAFLNGRIDLAQAEGVASIVAARSSGALRASVRQLEGGLSDRLRDVRRTLVGLLAQIEATVDFSDEDIDALDWQGLGDGLLVAQQDLQRLLRTAFVGQALEHGLRTAIVGKPNVGKSSLLNALLMRERAIVSDTPGTTRDTVEELMEIGGIPIHLVDTAGMRVGGDDVERLGVERSVKAMEQADLVLAVIDVSQAWDRDDRDFVLGLDPARTIVVFNKLDLVADGPTRIASALGTLTGDARTACAGGAGGAGDEGGAGRPGSPGEDANTAAGARWLVRAVSAVSFCGLDELRQAIEEVVSGGDGLHLEEPVLSSERQRGLVGEAAASTAAALANASSRADEELICEDIREAVQAIGRITGEDLTRDLLDEIFSRFCIGK
jgi:tRNA modification GTPase